MFSVHPQGDVMASSLPAPRWLYFPLPANAAQDEELHVRIEDLCSKLPDTFGQLQKALEEVRPLSIYEPAVNLANVRVWERLEHFLGSPDPSRREWLLYYVAKHFPARALARVLRRLAKDPNSTVRSRVRRAISRAKIQEVAVPHSTDGPWDSSGWMLPEDRSRVTRHKTGTRVQNKVGVPPVQNLKQLRKLLDIRSTNQLGYFLLATDLDDGPYTTYTVPKRSGSDRLICAPKKQLKWVQRLILLKILNEITPHPAAHGFVSERSTVTNAGPHVGAKVVVKFDLKDFFPTIHYYRVMGLFASLGYSTGNCLFGTDDDSKQIAPVLARLCCYTAEPTKWGSAVLPQGAPTSPAISNLVCRRLDARLAGLAQKNEGIYTRYADDLTFSFHTTVPDLGRFRWWVDQLCQQEGFAVNQDKFRVVRETQRQIVTGIVVNETLHLPREERRRFRAILHNCKRDGIDAQTRGNPRFGAYLRGFAAYLNMVQPVEGAELLRQVNELLGSTNPGGPTA